MEIRTGYFAYSRKYDEANYVVVGITRFPPRWFQGLNLIEFSPSAELLLGLKSGAISEQVFEEKYLDYLKALGDYPLEVLNSLEFDKIILCCFEKTGSFCHRHILAKYLNKTFGLDIKELVIGG